MALVMIDSTDSRQSSPQAFAGTPAGELQRAVSAHNVPLVLVLNKVDRIDDKTRLLPMLEQFSATGTYREVIPTSALKGEAVRDVEQAIGARMPIGPRLFPEDMLTDRAERFLAAEFVREQLFLQLGQELPYATAVEVLTFEERADAGDVVIAAVIYVERDSQKGMVIGKGGRKIKMVGERARQVIGELLACEVHLKLHVKVAADWSRTVHSMKQLGYNE